MISHLAGRVTAVAPDGAVIEVGGVGLLVQCTPGTLATLRPGEHARVATSLVVREDALTLFGFASDDGPRLALAMLAVFTPDALRRAVLSEDVAALTRVPGIGRKGAQRIVLELAGRLGAPGTGSPGAGDGVVTAQRGGQAPWREQVRAGLVNLGWQARDADQAIAAVEADLAEAATADGEVGDGTPAQEADAAVMLRAALRKLSRA